jgi:hypothetical protein
MEKVTFDVLDRARSVKGYAMEARDELTEKQAARKGQRNRRSSQDPARRRCSRLRGTSTGLNSVLRQS